MRVVAVCRGLSGERGGPKPCLSPTVELLGVSVCELVSGAGERRRKFCVCVAGDGDGANANCGCLFLKLPPV